MKVFQRVLAGCATLLVVCFQPPPAAAQLVPLGSSPAVVPSPYPDLSPPATAVAYDPVHDVYLYVSGGTGATTFVDADGNRTGPPLTLPGSGALAVAYSPDVSDGAGGQGGFLVTWARTCCGELSVYAQLISYPAGLVGPVTTVQYVAYPGTLGSTIRSTSVAYSPSGRVFLVAIGRIATLGNAPVFVRVGLDGRAIGGATTLPATDTLCGYPYWWLTASPCGQGEVQTAWNPVSQEFGVLHNGFMLSLTRVRADGAIAGQTALGPGTGAHSLAVNRARGTYFVAAANTSTQIIEVSASGEILGRHTVASRAAADASWQGLALAYSEPAGGFALDLFGLVMTLNDDGTPTGLSLDCGAWDKPAIAASTRTARWLVTLPRGYLAVGLGGRPADWRGDFTGDGSPDLIWQRSDTTAILLWEMHGTTFAAGTLLDPDVPGKLWPVVGAGDFTGDGKRDLLRQDPATGALMVWVLDGFIYGGGITVFHGGTEWRVAAVADFNRDGSPDILWQHPATGAVLLWTMYGSAYMASTILNSGGTMWKIVAAADFTRDGRTDLLWQDPATGALLLWEMNGSAYQRSTMISPGGTYWRVVAAADYTADGITDIVWQHPDTGALLLWEMNGAAYGRSIMLTDGGTLWQVKAPR